MILEKCECCGGEIAKNTKQCPHCGLDYPCIKEDIKRMANVIAAIIIIGVLVWIISLV